MAVGSQFTTYINPLLAVLKSLGGSAKSAEAKAAVAKHMRLSDAVLDERLASGSSRFDNQVSWARYYLVRSGFIDSSRRGVWALTEKGRSVGTLSQDGIARVVQLSLPFSITASYVLQDGDLQVADGSDFRIRTYSDGLLTEIYGVDREQRSVSDAARETWIKLFDQVTDSAQRAEIIALLDHPMRRKSLPGYAQLLTSSTGEVWARVYSPDPFGAAIWDVYSPDREWQGQIQTPAGFVSSVIDGDRLIGVWFDQLGVEYVRAYAIERGRPGTQ